ncbi:MFS transporter [Microbacter margulisiae]|uniref:GPH family glycoside/pentoside/hexuronide:cation symporter n=1 Tax=Microbacter margulisiae TaxID=1350067 RepID=A0A7W5H3R8_9PORP|nr:MFS transporter [Microbacter margulisiae]MBB3188721.1 GPH family glycoside/pentoside/hexuronide:cation symporter [Microbacter margulisiae]
MATIKLKEKIGYGFGDFASSMFWKIFTMYLLFFYTDVFGLPAAAVGTMFLVTRFWDTIFDPVVGIISDRTESKWGKFRPYLLWGALPFGIIGTLMFITPSFGSSGKLIYAYITYTLMMMVYSTINVPYASLLGVISSNPKERNSLSSYRMVFAFIGSFVALLLIDPLVQFFKQIHHGNIQLGWTMGVMTIAVLCILFFWGCFALTKERIQPISEKTRSLKADIKDLIANRPWWILLGAGISALIFNSIRDGAAVYYFKYYVNKDNMVQMPFVNLSLTLTTLYLVLGQAANILGIILVTPLSTVIGKKGVYLSSMAVATVLSIFFFFLSPHSIALMMILQFFISICAGSIFPLLWSMYADIADFSEWKNNRRATGLIFSSSSMSQKFGWAIGGALTGWLLSFVGFHANVMQTHETLTGIRMMLSVFPAIGTALSVLFIAFYPLNEKKLTTIVSELNEKRKQH